jgi:XTP/dITP diphosphohydrolase
VPKLLIASNNPGKIREYHLLLEDSGFNIVGLKELGINKATAETGNSYEDNARIKAAAYVKLSRLITLADDSGLEVEALNGEPGIQSARFAGEAASDADKVKFLLARLAGVPWEKRTAYFKCVIAIATPEGKLELCHGECHGIIAFEAQGKNGFGYDPIFYLPEMGKTMAELPLEVKNRISHRAQAAHKAQQILQQLHNQFIDCHHC